MNFNELKQTIEELDPKNETDWKTFDALVASCMDSSVTKYLSDTGYYSMKCSTLKEVCTDKNKRSMQLKIVLEEAYKLASDTELADLLNDFARKAGITYRHKN